ncbi:hypothetical protein FOCC_FOCC014348 [Frankliniella occidentalis]|nr:hypothetical protein FOCC_FOCC014348 [Frankliniella occidentalis]
MEEEEEEDEVSAMLRDRDRVRSQNNSLSPTDIATQLNTYFRDTPRIKDRKTSILKWWEDKKHTNPELYEVAKVVHAIPATQVRVERLFSALRFVMHHLRGNLSASMVEDLVLILNNSRLVKEDILVLIGTDSHEDDDDDDTDLERPSTGLSDISLSSLAGDASSSRSSAE